MTCKKTLCEKIKKVAIFLVYPAILFLVMYLMPYAIALVFAGVLLSNNAFLFFFCLFFFYYLIILYFILPLLLTIIALKKWGNYFNKYFDNMLYPSFLLVFVCLLIAACEINEDIDSLLVKEILQGLVLPHVIIIFIFFAVRTIVKRLKKK